MFYDVILLLGCKIVGYWLNEGYEFIVLKVLIEDKI